MLCRHETQPDPSQPCLSTKRKFSRQSAFGLGLERR
jgi:hypothetical protein